MSIISPNILPRPTNKQETDLFKVLENFIRDVKSILNGGVKFTDNFDAVVVEYVSHATEDTELVCAHTLGKIPTGYIVINQNKTGTLYDSGNTWTATDIYLKCSVAAVTYKLLIF